MYLLNLFSYASSSKLIFFQNVIYQMVLTWKNVHIDWNYLEQRVRAICSITSSKLSTIITKETKMLLTHCLTCFDTSISHNEMITTNVFMLFHRNTY